MSTQERVTVAVLYGGRSSEHEISLQSAKCVLEQIETSRFDVLPIAIDKDGRWHVQDLKRLRASASKALPLDAQGQVVALERGEQGAVLVNHPVRRIDVVLPILHGPLYEDGSIQGLCELVDVAYVGPAVLGSAICMDKDVAKRLVRAAGIDTPEYVCVRKAEWPKHSAHVKERVTAELAYPVFVKPASLGSSVGVIKVKSEKKLEQAVEDAFAYDTKVLIERAVNAREIELAVLSSLDPASPPEVSVPGEIVPKDSFYSYERKYLDPEGAELRIPAPLSPQETVRAQRIAREAFVALECEGMARIDLFLDRSSGELLFNEANTIPGFTTISMYPKLWEASGLSYSDLLRRLIELALQRHTSRSRLRRAR